MTLNYKDFILEWFLEAHIHILFQSVHFPKKNLFEPLVRLTEGDVASIGPPITQFAIFLSIICMFTTIFSNIYCYIPGDLHGFDVICWLLVGHDILWDYCDMTWNWSSRCLAMPSFPAAFSPLCRCWKHTNTQIHKYTNTELHIHTNTHTKFNETPFSSRPPQLKLVGN